MTINEMRDKSTKEITALLVKVFLLGKDEGLAEGAKSIDRYDDGYIAGAVALKDALLDDDFLDMHYDGRSPGDVLTDFRAGEILRDYKEYVEEQKKIDEGWVKFETSTNNHKIRAKCHQCGYLMNWEDRTKYCPECGNHNSEE